MSKGNEIRQNRPNWRKARGWKKKMKKKEGSPLRDSRGRPKFDNTVIKTKEWEKVKV